MKPIVLFCLGVLMLACSPQSSIDSGARPFTAILVTDVGGLGDKGFNDSGWAGCQDAQQRLLERGVELEVHVIESREQTDYVDNLNLAAERGDIVIGLGFLIADAIKQVADYHPDTHFLFIDGQVEGPNIASYAFHAQDGGFLAGLLASYMTQSGVVGVAPGMDIPPVQRFAAGYRAGVVTGARLQGREIKTLTTVIGSFNDPVKGKSLAKSLMSQGADIIFQLAGNSGLGVIEAVKESPQGTYVIGVDIDQDDLLPGRILTSVLKRMDRVVSDKTIAAYDDKFEPGVYQVGLKEGYVSLTEMKHTRDGVPSQALVVLDRAKALITDGKIKPPAVYDDLEAFIPPVELLESP
ncbi:MAG: BMP family ABC transporter substrate-binding protein [Candidatus Hinthialibacter antarcticus]|nr:BMP family ABC transporter substrate-binding protein [Candidatus Hinthialibacter antarcticus]